MGPSGDGESESSDGEETEEGAMALFKMDSWLQMKMDIQVILPPVFIKYYMLSFLLAKVVSTS